MKSKNSDVFLMIAIVFAILGGIFIAYSLNQPIIYENNDVETTNEGVSFQQEVSFPVNLNTATVEELLAIPNVGEYTAYAIVDYRDKIGSYSSVEQIMDIYGIGESTYYEISGYLTL